MRPQTLSPAPQSSPLANGAHAAAVITLRGASVPMVDMRLKFNLEQASYDAFTVARDYLMAIDAVEQRRLILIDIEKLMSGSEMGLVETTLHGA